MAYVPFASDEYLPGLLMGWMRRRGREHWVALGRAIATVVDTAADTILRARVAAMPGQVTASDYAEGGPWPNASDLPVIGRDRGIRKGKYEDPEDYAARLRAWLEAKRAAGTYPALIGALRAVLAPTPPMVRIVRGGVPTSAGVAPQGYFWTLDDTGLRYQTWDGVGVFWAASGAAPVPDATEAHPWDWDSKFWDEDPDTVPDPSRLWGILYAPVEPELTALEGPFDDGLSVFGEVSPEDGDKLTIGTTATAQYVAIARAVCDDFKSAGVVVSHIIVTFEEGLFDPADTLLDDWPDGLWRHHGKIEEVSGLLRRIRARSDKARYWLGTATRWSQYSSAGIE